MLNVTLNHSDTIEDLLPILERAGFQLIGVDSAGDEHTLA